MSLIFEFFIRTYLIQINLNSTLSTFFAFSFGMFFAFWANVRFNFKIPRSGRNRALIYFILISCFSGMIQLFFIKLLEFDSLSYEWGRLLISGGVFIVAYSLHRKYSFKDFKKVGVAIYANGVEDLNKIHKSIGHYADFIHIDIVDKTMNENAEEINAYRLETMKSIWPDTEVQSHIMSTEPSRWLEQVLPYSDVVYVHVECDENVENLFKIIRKNGKKAGLALTMSTDPGTVSTLLEKADYVLLLTIPKPGTSGQKFDTDGLLRIKQINKFSFRSQFVLCVDGGVNENIINVLEAENIVSGSSVLKSNNPKRQIMRLQTVGRYEV